MVGDKYDKNFYIIYYLTHFYINALKFNFIQMGNVIFFFLLVAVKGEVNANWVVNQMLQ
jgi:hypothetical protein